MKKKKLKKAISATAAAVLVLPMATNMVGAKEASAAVQTGATYYQTEDNAGQGGSAGADGDLDYRLANTDGKHPVEFNVNVQNPAANATSAALVIRGNDVDEEAGEWDRVYLNNGEQPVGALSGNDSTWNSTVFYLDPAAVKEGSNYVEILINDRDDPRATNWQLEVDWGQIVMNDGPKDQIEIDRTTPPAITGTGSSRTVTYNTLPHAPGEYIAEINLLDKDGNNVATIQQEINTNGTDPQKLTAVFKGLADKEYTTNVIFLEKDGEKPGKIQDMWTSNKPPVVRTLTTLTPAAIDEAFVDLDSPEDALAEVTFSGIPQGILYAGGEPVAVTNGTVVLTSEQVRSGLAFVPGDPETEEVTFTWNGSDGTMYALAPAEVILDTTLQTIEKPVKQNKELPFANEVTINENYQGIGPVASIVVTGIPAQLHGLKDKAGNLVAKDQKFTPEEFKELKFDAADLEEGSAVYQWAVSYGDNEAITVPLTTTFNITDGISPVIETAVVNDSDPYPKTITLTYDENIQVTDAAGFTVTIGGVAAEIESAVSDGKNKLTLTLAEPIKPGDTLKLDYNADEGNVSDNAGNKAVPSTGETAIAISNQVREPLDGWAGDQPAADENEVIVKPGDTLALAAISEIGVDKLLAVLFEGTEDEIFVPLDLISTESGHKVWGTSEFKLPQGTATGDYQVGFIAYDANGEKIQTETAARQANNDFYVAAEIDLAGTVTDQRTEKPLAKAVVTLIDAETEKPIIDPATKEPFRAETDENGQYRFTDVPTGTVTIMVQKSGYRSLRDQIVDTMPKTKEETTITSDMALSKASSGGTVPVYIPDAALDFSLSSERVLAGSSSKVAVNYENKAAALLHTGTISVVIPKGVKIVNADGGKVDGQEITWTLANVPAEKGGQFTIELEWPEIETAETSVQLAGTLTATNPNSETRTFTSSATVQLYKEQAELLEHTRYIMGYKDGEFKPGESVTRGQLAAILARLAGNPEVKGALDYRDVKEGHWATDYIKVVTENGYFSGYGDNTFRQGKPLTRGELASVIVRFMDLKVEQKPNYHFTDTKGHWAAPAIETLYSKNYLSGYKDGTFRPDTQIDRAEAVTMINRMLDRGPLKGHSSIYSDIDERYWAFGDIMEATISHKSQRNTDGSESFKEKIKDEVK